MSEEKDLKTVLKSLAYQDSARVQEQIVEDILKAKTSMGAIRHKILVLSGKGGVGKSTVSAHLAVALARQGLKVGLLDVDVNGPCIPKLFHLDHARMDMKAEGALPVKGPFGLKVASMGFFLQEGRPARWKGPLDLAPVYLGALEMSVIREFLADVLWGELDCWIADLPPGAAADKPPAIAGFIPELDGAVVVTTPSPLSLSVVERSIHYAQDAGIKILGLVENMTSHVCSACGHEESLFPSGSKISISASVLGYVPFSRRIAEGDWEAGGKYFEPIAKELIQKLDISQ